STLLAVHPSREEGTPSDSSPLALLALLAVRSSLARRARRATASLDPLGGSFFSRGGRDERQPPSTLLAVHSSREEGAASDSLPRPSWRFILLARRVRRATALLDPLGGPPLLIPPRRPARARCPSRRRAWRGG